ncbi:MAG: thioesterase family protein [Sphingobium sp.]
MPQDPYFREENGRFVPLEVARGYWSRDMLHGRPLIGIIGRELERVHGDPAFIPARFNVDLHRTPRFAPVEVETRLLRSGGRLRLAEAVLTIDGEEYARATCQFLRVGEAPPGRIWAPAPWDVPSPHAIAPRPDPKRRGLSEMRPIAGRMGAYGPRQVWTREYFDLVEGQTMTPFARVALAADFASPWTHIGDAGVHYMNTDIVVHLHRLPRGEWLGFEVTGHDASQGIAVGHCRLYDADGAIGFISATALTNQRR